ncbi:Maph4 [Matsumuraeses phaseoli granulovirus]|uniref:Maph4 n=1 Tax=Matsumuraeses phaseoli granulovirus TaxID=2760664 RepID=A0AAE7ML79_9BBAC|nr:Maph4 [Matsumuraeses phaseoli granulovirus]QOD39967.1 Maph4 [Matsumuraeses phaseoli granulovirus]
MLSIFFNDVMVYYNFDDLVKLMVDLNFEQADKKMLAPDRLKIVGANEQVFYTDGTNIDVKLVLHDECYISFEGVLDMIDKNVLAQKDVLESIVVSCTSRVVKNPYHKWLISYVQVLRARVNSSFDFYFKVLEQYMLANQPHVDKIGCNINQLITLGEKLKICDDVTSLMSAYRSFDEASALMLKYLNK